MNLQLQTSESIADTPPLQAGDFLSRDEFLRRWEAAPNIKFAELIGGIVYMPSPLSLQHGSLEFNVGTWLGVYQTATPGCAGANNATTFLLEDSPQPDIHLRILPEFGGLATKDGKYLAGPPELVTEICVSSASYDLNQKLDLYQDAGVPEYLAILGFEKEVRWHVMVDSEYQLLEPGEDGIHRSRVFPGLWLNGRALFEDRMNVVMATLQEGLASPEHRAFAQKLAESRRAGGV